MKLTLRTLAFRQNEHKNCDLCAVSIQKYGATLRLVMKSLMYSLDGLLKYFDSQYFCVVRLKIWCFFPIVHSNHLSLLFRFSLSLSKS